VSRTVSRAVLGVLTMLGITFVHPAAAQVSFGSPADPPRVALGGGAMASGIGCVAKALAPNVEVIGIQPAGAPALTLSWRTGAVVNSETIDTIADGVAGRYPIPEVLDDLLVVLDDVVLVSEDSIKAGMRMLYQHAGLVVEPSAALGVAAVHIERNRPAEMRRAIAAVVEHAGLDPAWA